MKIFSYSFFSEAGFFRLNEKGLSMQSAMSFAQLRPAGFAISTGQAGWGGADRTAYFFTGRVAHPCTVHCVAIKSRY